jgi:hypothetical protein
MLVGMLGSDYGKEALSAYNTKEKFYSNTVSGLERMFATIFPLYQTLNGATKNFGLSDATLTKYSSLFNYLGNTQGKNAQMFSGITVPNTNGYFGNEDKKRAYTQLFGSRKYDPTTDKIQLKLDKGVFLTTDGAILIAEELAKTNQTQTERIKSGYNANAAANYADDSTVIDGVDKETVQKVNEHNAKSRALINGQTLTAAETLDVINKSIDKGGQLNKALENQKTTSDIIPTETPDAMTFGAPQFTINIEGSADEKTITAMRGELTNAFNEYTDLLTSKISTSFQRQSTTNATK